MIKNAIKAIAVLVALTVIIVFLSDRYLVEDKATSIGATIQPIANT